MTWQALSVRPYLGEEFVMVTLLAMCSVDMRRWQAEHGGAEITMTPGPPTQHSAGQAGQVS